MTLELTQTARPSYRINYNALVNGLLFLLVACGSVTFIEPSPYDILLVAFFGVWFFSGFHLHVSTLPIIALPMIAGFAAFFAQIPWFHAPDSVSYWISSMYLFVTLPLFAVVFGEDSSRRAERCLQGLLVSCVFAAALGVIGWLDLWGTEKLFTIDKRAMGPFKDPNVFGSYVIVGYLYLLQRELTGAVRGLLAHLVTIALIGLLLGGVLLSFSRGSWASAVMSSILMWIFTFRSTDQPRARHRMVMIMVGVIGVAVAGLVVALSYEQVRDMFMMRASLNQEYDLGETGRFGNQLRSLPMLLELPNGMGPLRFRSFFGLDPHNSYIGGFANHGWIGGLAFLLIVVLSLFVGARVCYYLSPFRRPAHVFFIIMLMFFIQGFQIDIDHWRFVYLFMGAIWGLETARLRWLARKTQGASASAVPALIA